MMPKEQVSFIDDIAREMFKRTDMDTYETIDFAFRVWQAKEFLRDYLNRKAEGKKDD